MRDAVIAAVKQLAATWAQDAGNRRTRSKVDPVADTMESCASEMLAEIARVDDATRLLTVEQYANDHAASPSTVRRWIQRGQLEAEKSTAGEWMIPRSARRRMKSA